MAGVTICHSTYQQLDLGHLSTDATGLYGLERAAAGRAAEAGIDVIFSHEARHLVGTGLSVTEVEAATESEIAQQLAGTSAEGWFWGRVTIDGQTIEYRAFALPDGTVNFGTYYVVP